MRGWLVAAAIVFGSTATAAGPVDRADLDKRLAAAALEVTKLGTDLFNAGDPNGCLRVYQGALIAVGPLLDHRPAVAAAVTEKLAAAKTMATRDAAFALRKVLDDVRAETGGPAKPLWDRLGGEPAVKAVVHEFVAAAAGDPKVNFFRDGAFKLDAKGVERLERLLVELVSSAAGGPLQYTGRDMKAAHKGMKITDAEFDALAGHLVAALKKFKVPQAEIDELVAVVAGTRKDIVEVGK